MFGYLTINKNDLKVKEYEEYQSYYCGLCKVLKERYGHIGQMTLTYDMTFLVILLTGLYEKEPIENIWEKSIAHGKTVSQSMQRI